MKKRTEKAGLPLWGLFAKPSFFFAMARILDWHAVRQNDFAGLCYNLARRIPHALSA
jgi:hypothetical protein